MARRFGLMSAVTFCSVVGLAGVAAAQQVLLVGCPYRGPAPGCVLMKGKTGTVFLVNSAKPPVPVKQMVIRLRGYTMDEPNLCGAARVVKYITWTATHTACVTIPPKL